MRYCILALFLASSLCAFQANDPQAALLQAIHTQNVDALTHAVEQGADVNHIRPGELPPLFYALDTDSPALVHQLLARGAQTEPIGVAWTALTWALSRHDVLRHNLTNAILELLRSHVNVTLSDAQSRVPIFMLIATQDIELIGRFLQNVNAPFNTIAEQGTSLTHAIRNSIGGTLFYDYFRVNNPLIIGVTLALAYAYNQQNVFEFLLLAGASEQDELLALNAVDIPLIQNALANNTRAKFINNFVDQLVKPLSDTQISRGTMIQKMLHNLVTNFGVPSSLLTGYAIINRNIPLVLWCFRTLNTPVESYFRGTPSLSWAITIEDPTLISILLKMGADPNQLDYHYAPPLFYVLQTGNVGLIASMIYNKARADFNRQDLMSPEESLSETFWTPGTVLTKALVEKLHVTVLLFLLSHGAQAVIDAVDAQGNTALHYAAHFNLPEQYQALLDRGANPDITNALGQTAEQLLSHTGASE